MVQLVLKFFLDHVPAYLGVGNDAPGTVLEAGGQDTEVALAREEKKRAVAEKTRLPVIKLVAGHKLAFRIDEMFVIHNDESFFCFSFALLFAMSHERELSFLCVLRSSVLTRPRIDACARLRS